MVHRLHSPISHPQSHLPSFISTHWAEEQAPPLDREPWRSRRPHRAKLNLTATVPTANQIQKPHLRLAGLGLGASPACIRLDAPPRASHALGDILVSSAAEAEGPNPPFIQCHWLASTLPSRMALPSCICQIREPGQPELVVSFWCCARDQGLTQLLGLMLSPPQPRSTCPCLPDSAMLAGPTPEEPDRPDEPAPLDTGPPTSTPRRPPPPALPKVGEYI